MKKMRYIRSGTAMLVALLIILQSVGAFALTSKAACAMDVYSGEVLYKYNADEPLAPASMTKVMTAYIIYDKMAQGAFDKSSAVICTENASKLSKDPVATNVPLEAGESYTIDELIGAIMLPSACAACTLVGEYISGSEEEFARLMNQYVYSLGLEAYFDDASGISDNNRIIARSMAKLASQFIRQYPDILNYTSQPSISFRGKTYNNTNYLLSGAKYEYEGADGLKTGTTTLAGKCLTATAVHDYNRIVGVTMRSTTTASRYTDIHEILDAGFAALSFNENGIYANSSKIFINNIRVPSFYIRADKRGQLILAENLACYGFDVNYNKEDNTLYIVRDKQKPFIPVVSEQFINGQRISEVTPKGIKVVLNDDGYLYTFEQAYELMGYTAISVDELKNIYRFDNGYFKIN